MKEKYLLKMNTMVTRKLSTMSIMKLKKFPDSREDNMAFFG